MAKFKATSVRTIESPYGYELEAEAEVLGPFHIHPMLSRSGELDYSGYTVTPHNSKFMVGSFKSLTRARAIAKELMALSANWDGEAFGDIFPDQELAREAFDIVRPHRID
ncbi:hypothetical protein [Bosea lathyri]|uniref:Uncharacterized protein n=1 Tax=Bosea lathyri TaxID=1036778 RepID=A0A1H6BVI5_9HYPH|nr:hypothetical protein [Bosea lathyri]SEG64689.1 hypothetical protein SAMN04488115_108117 [Bosea lathyri]